MEVPETTFVGALVNPLCAAVLAFAEDQAGG
jgi:hypothetical protein